MQIIFSSITLHVRVALKSQYLFVVGAKPFPANRNVKHERFHCAFKIFHIVAGSDAPDLLWIATFFLYNRDVYDEHLKMCSHMAINYLIFDLI